MLEENPTELGVLSEDGSNTIPLQSEIKQDDVKNPARTDTGTLKNRKKMCCVTGILLIIIVIISIGAIVHLQWRCNACVLYKNTGVASDAAPCSKIGRDIMKWNGSVVDAAIAALLCIGLVNAHSMGIGGGLILTIYNASTGQVEVINSREVAPEQEMTRSLETGGPSIAVPGEIRGYALAHQWHGRLPWKQLFEPSIKLARKGFPVGGLISRDDLKQYKANKETPINVTLDEYTLYVPGAPSGGPVLALILKILEGYHFSRESVSTREKKVLTYHRIIEAFKFGFAERSKLEYPTSSDHSKVNEMISKANDIREKISDSHTNEKIDYYGMKCFLPGQDGTSHLSVVAQDGSAVSVTSTINGRFGSFVRSNVTGIIFNNQMADFSQYRDNNSLPPCSENYVQPGRRPFSAMSPVIILDKDKKVKMVVGASGSSRIITATALVIMNALWFGDDACEAVKKPRVHHQLLPNLVQFESEELASNAEELRQFRKEIEDDLKKKMHISGFADMPSVVQVIVREGNVWHAVSDTTRKGGCPAGY
ncbi:hypothetical protein scyTo_0008447 [Scyliorhinus torazame]|uniref:Gamma-glutamyltransferase n=1 Tax=Scyliorhinus torazame TaxID=75743 RepID=A0A401P9G2_SCYTO|nr:hypothetical protein [Scyliorhinus torazame]